MKLFCIAVELFVTNKSGTSVLVRFLDYSSIIIELSLVTRGIWGFGLGQTHAFLSIFQLLVQATMGVYKEAIDNFLPTPAKSHYVFNLRDFARVIRGVLLVPHDNMSEVDKLYRLWVHEVYRVFYDRLTDHADR